LSAKEIISIQVNKHTESNYQAGYGFYLRFLRETNNYNPNLKTDARFHLAKEWDAIALLKVKQWIDATNSVNSKNYLTSYTVMGHVSAIRKTMYYAFEELAKIIGCSRKTLNNRD